MTFSLWLGGGTEMGRVQGKVAIVTGGASGIGHATVERLAEEGARVVLADIDDAASERIARDCADRGLEVVAIHCDVSSVDDWRKLIDTVGDRYGALHILHNNAAITSADIMSRDRPVVDLDLDVYSRMLNVDLYGTLLGCKSSIPLMIESGGGSIINTSSMASTVGSVWGPSYGVAKAGVNILTKYVAAAYGRQGVRCNTVSPGVVIQPKWAEMSPPAMLERMLRQNLVPRLGNPKDLANLVLFLASEESAYITGVFIPADGGATAHVEHGTPWDEA